jgi:glucan 1,3-beta-glucosidase
MLAATQQTDDAPMDSRSGTSGTRLRGVNLGGWLVLEKWMTPSLFQGLAARDETDFCVELGGDAAARLRAHRASFVGRDDFAWLAETGVNAVRIPVGHWIFGAPYPYHARYGASAHPYVEGGIDVLDRALDWASEAGLRVVLDLHAAPGGQNGFDNGGLQDVCEWHTREEYLAHSVDVLGRLASRYRACASLHAIEVLNEPRWDVPTELLASYNARAYRAIRAHCGPERVAVVIHDGFRPHRAYLGRMPPPDFANVLFDVHRYQCFAPEDVALDVAGHVRKASVEWRDEADAIQRELALPAIVGEWSLGLAPEPAAYDGSAAEQRAYRDYAEAQLLAFERYHGWFFWSYRTERAPAWCFRACVERGWLPSRFA